MNRLYSSWQDVPRSEWRWPNFSPQEIACKGTGRVLIDERSMDALQALRTRLGKPLLITSAYRSPEHNRAVGGASNSQHLYGKAFDVVMTNHNPAQFEEAAKACGFNGIGHYPASNFMHIDTRSTPAKWKGTGRNNAWFEAQPATPEFTAPTRRPAMTETMKQLGPVVWPILVGGGAIAQGNGPVQWAIGLIAVAAFFAAVVWFVRRKRGGENA
jgi:hypothetical protein